MVDSISKFSERYKCKNPTSVVTVSFSFREWLTKCDIPDTIVSDNETHLTSDEFGGFCKNFVIEHLTTPPYPPRSNGHAKHFIVTFKLVIENVSTQHEYTILNVIRGVDVC